MQNNSLKWGDRCWSEFTFEVKAVFQNKQKSKLLSQSYIVDFFLCAATRRSQVTLHCGSCGSSHLLCIDFPPWSLTTFLFALEIIFALGRLRHPQQRFLLLGQSHGDVGFGIVAQGSRTLGAGCWLQCSDTEKWWAVLIGCFQNLGSICDCRVWGSWSRLLCYAHYYSMWNWSQKVLNRNRKLQVSKMGVLQVVENTAEEPFIQVKLDKICSFVWCPEQNYFKLSPRFTVVLFPRLCYARN